MELNANLNVMEKNDQQAAANRCLFASHGVLALNIIASPGAGKTTLLERLLERLPAGKAAVIEGDLATARDAARIAAKGTQVVQINTDGGCHLDAAMIAKVLPLFDLAALDLLFIENVGNLVCPVDFDLGEDARLVLLSVAEGGDKPMKYPAAFLSAAAVALNKLDMLALTDFDLAAVKAELYDLKPGLKIFETVCRRDYEQGLDQLTAWLLDMAAAKKAGR